MPELPRGRGLNNSGNGCAGASLARAGLDKCLLILLNLFIETNMRNILRVRCVRHTSELQCVALPLEDKSRKLAKPDFLKAVISVQIISVQIGSLKSLEHDIYI